MQQTTLSNLWLREHKLSTNRFRSGCAWVVRATWAGPTPAHQRAMMSVHGSLYSRARKAPFSRDQWLDRCNQRRKNEWKSKHVEELNRISPLLMHKFHAGRLGTADYMSAVNAYKQGGDEYTLWTQKNVKRRDPAFNPCAWIKDCLGSNPPISHARDARAVELWTEITGSLRAPPQVQDPCDLCA